MRTYSRIECKCVFVRPGRWFVWTMTRNRRREGAASDVGSDRTEMFFLPPLSCLDIIPHTSPLGCSLYRLVHTCQCIHSHQVRTRKKVGKKRPAHPRSFRALSHSPRAIMSIRVDDMTRVIRGIVLVVLEAAQNRLVEFIQRYTNTRKRTRK